MCYSKSAVHISGDVFAHRQDDLTVFTVSGNVHPSCSRHQLAATWVNTTRYCKYSRAPDDGWKHRPKHVELTWNNKLTYMVHLVGYFYSYISAGLQKYTFKFTQRNKAEYFAVKKTNYMTGIWFSKKFHFASLENIIKLHIYLHAQR